MNEKNQLINFIDDNFTVPQIASKLKISESSVWRRMKNFGLKTNRAWTHESDIEEKECVRCGEVKHITQFPLAGGKKDNGKYRRRYCASCYEDTKMTRRKDMREWFENYKKTLKCESCDNSDFRVLEFHHKNGSKDKDENIATVVSGAKWSRERIMKEVSKCSVLCANCHRVLHYEERNRV